MDHSNSAVMRRHKLVLPFAAIMAFISPAAGVDVNTHVLGAKRQALDSTAETVNAGYYAATTLSAEDPDLAAANIKQGVTIFGFAGNYTGDADAIADDIVIGKTAYVNGVKLTGTLTTQSLSAANDTVTAGNYTATTLSAVDPDLAAGNIRSGIGIFGINGSLLPSGGTAGPGDVVSGKTFYGSGQSDWALQTGSLNNLVLGWGADGNGNPTNKSWWPTSLVASGRTGGTNATASINCYPYATSSPLYAGVTGAYAVTSLTFDGTVFKSLLGHNTDTYGYMFHSSGAGKDLTTEKTFTILENDSGGDTMALQSVLYGTLRKLTAGTDYAEELRGADNLTKGWAWNYSPTPSDFNSMDSISGPYTNLHDESVVTYYSVSSTADSESSIMHKIILTGFSEDSVRLYVKNTTSLSGGHTKSANLYVWNFNTSAWDGLDSISLSDLQPGNAIKVLDIAKSNTNYIQSSTFWILSLAGNSNNFGDTVTTFYYDMDLWAGYKNPQD